MPVSIGELQGKISWLYDGKSIKLATTDLQVFSAKANQLVSKISNKINEHPFVSLAAVAGTAALAVHAVYNELAESQAALAQLEAGIISTGGAAGYSAEQLEDMAGALQKLTGVDDEAIEGAEGILLTFTNIRNEIYQRTLPAVLDLSARFGIDLTSSAQMLGKALQDPEKGVTTLGRKLGGLPEDVKKSIKSFMDLGQIEKAQSLLLDQINKKVGGSAEAFRKTLPGAIQALKGSWGNLLEDIGKSADSGGFFMVAIDGMVKGLDYLGENWGALESAVFETLGQITKGITETTAFILRQVELSYKLLRIGAIVQPAVFQGLGKSIEAVHNIQESIRKTGDDIYQGFKIKAADAIDSLDKPIKKAQKSLQDFDLSGVGEEAEKLAQKINDITDAQTLATQSTIARAEAENLGGHALLELNNQLDAQAEALQKSQSLENASADTKEKLRLTLLALILEEKDWELQGKKNQALLESRMELEKSVSLGQIKLQEALSGSTDATRQLAAAEEAYQKAFSIGAENDKEFLSNLTKSIKGQLDYAHSLDVSIASIERKRKLESDLADLEARITDLISGSTTATRNNQIAQEAFNRALSEGALLNKSRYDQIIKDVKAEYALKSAKEAELAAEQRRADLRSDIYHANLDVQMYQDEINVLNKYGDVIGSIVNRYGLEASAAKEAMIQEKLLAAARAENINFHLSQSGSIVPESDKDFFKLLDLENEIRKGADELDVFKRKLADIDIHKALVEPFQELASNTIHELLDSVNEFVINGKLEFEDLWKSFAKQALEAVEAWLVRAIAAERLLRIEKAKTATAGAGASATGSGVGGAAGGAVGAMGALGVAFGAIALVLAFDKWFQKKKKQAEWEMIRIDEEGGNPYSSYAGNPRDAQVRRAHEVAEQVRQSIYSILDSITASGLVNLPQIQIRIRNDGKAFGAYVGDVLVGYFSNIQSATEAAIIEAFKESDLSKLPAIVAEAIRNSTSQTLEEFNRNIQQAQDIANLGLSQWTLKLNQILNLTQDRLRTLDSIFARSRLLNGETPAGGMSSGNHPLFPVVGGGGSTTSSFDKRSGGAKINPDEGPESEARRRIMEDQQRQIDKLVNDILSSLGIMSAGVKQHIEDVADSLSFLSDHLEQLGMSTEEFARITREAGENIYKDIADGLLQYVKNDKLRQSLEQLTYKQRIYSLRLEFEAAKLHNLLTQEEIDNLNQLFNQLPSKVPSSRGGGRSSNRDSVKDFIESKTYDLASAKLTEYQKKISDVNREYQEQIDQAGKDVNLRSQLIALKEQELALLKHDQINSVIADFQNFLGLTNQFDRVRQTSSDLIKKINDSPLGDARKASMIGRILQSTEETISRMSKESASGLLSSMISDMEQFGITGKALTDAQTQAAILEHTLKMANYAAEIEAVKLSGRLTQDQISALDQAYAALMKIDPTKFIENITPPTYRDWWGDNIIDGTNRFGEALQKAKDLLLKYQTDGLSPLARQIGEINSDFATIIKSMGRTPDVMNTYASAIKSAIDSFLEPIRQTRQDLFYGDLSPFDVQTQQAQALADFLSAQAKFNSGDLSVVSSLPDLARRLLELQRQISPEGSQGYASIAKMVDDLLKRVENVSVTDVLNDPMVKQMTSLNNISADQLDQLVAIYDASYRTMEAIEDLNSKIQRNQGGLGMVA